TGSRRTATPTARSAPAGAPTATPAAAPTWWRSAHSLDPLRRPPVEPPQRLPHEAADDGRLEPVDRVAADGQHRRGRLEAEEHRERRHVVSEEPPHASSVARSRVRGMCPIPVLETARLIMREWRRSDFD